MCIAGVGISCLDVEDDTFGKAFNIKPVAVFDMQELSNTCKVLREMFLDLKRIGEYGFFLHRGEEDNSNLSRRHLLHRCGLTASLGNLRFVDIVVTHVVIVDVVYVVVVVVVVVGTAYIVFC